MQSSNPCVNTRRAEWQSHRGTAGEADTRRRLHQLTTTRTRRSDHDLHTASRRRIDLWGAAEGIGTLCSGKNPSARRSCA
jgi:hypothetical protein